MRSGALPPAVSVASFSPYAPNGLYWVLMVMFGWRFSKIFSAAWVTLARDESPHQENVMVAFPLADGVDELHAPLNAATPATTSTRPHRRSILVDERRDPPSLRVVLIATAASPGDVGLRFPNRRSESV